MKRGLALEGGGAKGAYHVGVTKAFIEKGYEFDGFVGTSIGAINAAMLAQGDFDKALELWMSISLDQMFTEEEQLFLRLRDLGLNTETISSVRGTLPKIISNQGVSTKKMMELLNKYIDEEKIRASGKDFGLVTISISERKAYELMLDEIPRGKLIHYIMASSSLPGFSPVTIEGKRHIDGSFYNNCPVNLLDKLGYDEIIAIRTNALGVVYSKMYKMENVKLISPKEGLGSLMQFSSESSFANIRLGYYDGLRFIENLRGSYYYVRPVEADVCNGQLMALSDDTILEIGKTLGLSGTVGKRTLFERIIPSLSTYLKLGKDFDYVDFMIALLEQKAKQKKIERFQVYDYSQLCALVKKELLSSAKTTKRPTGPLPLFRKETAVELLINHLFSRFTG